MNNIIIRYDTRDRIAETEDRPVYRAGVRGCRQGDRQWQVGRSICPQIVINSTVATRASILQLSSIRRRWVIRSASLPFHPALPTHRLIYSITATSDLGTCGDLGSQLRYCLCGRLKGHPAAFKVDRGCDPARRRRSPAPLLSATAPARRRALFGRRHQSRVGR